MTWIEKYEITVYDADTDDRKVLHSPLARRAVFVSTDRLDEIKDLNEAPADMSFLTDYIPYDNRPAVKSPEDYTLLTVLPNNRCNFACSYCYSGKCRDDRTLDFRTLCDCIDYFVESKRDKPGRKKLTISFMGGGEPMLSWELVRNAVEYAEMKTQNVDVGISFRIITNGSLIDDMQIKFIKEHSIGISVSFEVLEEIQNMQRRHYSIVAENLRRLLNAEVDTQLNVTITPANVDRMCETYHTMRRLYPEVRNAMYEPVTSEEMFSSPDDMREFYRRYTTGFIDIYTRGRKEGVDLTSFPYLRTVYPIRRACPGEFCITADGEITGCYCVSMEKHPLFHRACYGNFKDGTFHFNSDVYQALLAFNKDTKPECGDCSARWSCGGGCWHQFNSYSAPYRQVVCEFTREYVRSIVITNLKLNNE